MHAKQTCSAQSLRASAITDGILYAEFYKITMSAPHKPFNTHWHDLPHNS